MEITDLLEPCSGCHAKQYDCLCIGRQKTDTGEMLARFIRRVIREERAEEADHEERKLYRKRMVGRA